MSRSSSADAIARIGWDNTDARAGARDFVQLAEKTKRQAETALGSIGSGIRFAASFAGFESAAGALQKVIDGIGQGWSFNRTLDDSTVGITNVLRRFDGLNKAAAKNEAAKALERIIELEPITAGGLQDLVSGFMGTLAAAKGVGLQTMQNVELVAKFANAIANAGLPLDQIRQEFRSILTSTITKDSQIAKILGITNEDMNAIRGDGDAIFSFLNAKLGEFAEAGDSATVSLSSLRSALDKALGGATQQLFQLSIRAAKQLTEQLKDPAYVAKLQEAGVDLARVAQGLLNLGGVLVDLAPGAIALGAKLASIVPVLASIAGAYAVIRLGKWTAEKIAAARATEASAQALRSETTALQQNTAAQNANAAAAGRAAKARVVTNAAGKQMVVGSSFAPNYFSAMGVQVPAAAGKAGEQAALTFRQRFNSAFASFPQTVGGRILGGLNGMTPLIASSFFAAFTDRSKSLSGRLGESIGGDTGGALAPALMDSVTFGLAAAGPYGVLAGVAIQLIDGAAAVGEQMGNAMHESMHKEIIASQARGGTQAILNLLDQGKNDAAASLLESRLRTAQAAFVAAPDAESRGVIATEIGNLEHLQANWDRFIAASLDAQTKIQQKKRADEEAAKAAEDAAKERQKETDEKRVAAWQKIHDLRERIASRKLDLLPDDAKLAALQARLKEIYLEASFMNLGKDVSSPAALQALADAQAKGGQAAAAADTLARLQEILDVTEKIEAANKRLAETAATEAERQRGVEFSRQQQQLETQILQAKVAAGGEDTAAVQALEDKLAVMNLARQIEDAGVATGKEALRLAQASVGANRELATLQERQLKNQEALRSAAAAQAIVNDYRVLQLRAAGKDDEAARLEKEIRLRLEAKRIMEETNVSAARAMQIAREMERVRTAAEARQQTGQDTGNERRRIIATNPRRFTEADRQAGWVHPSVRAGKAKLMGGGLDELQARRGTLSPWEQMQRQPSQWQLLQQGGTRPNPLQDQAAAAAGTGPNPLQDQAAANNAPRPEPPQEPVALLQAILGTLQEGLLE